MNWWIIKNPLTINMKKKHCKKRTSFVCFLIQPDFDFCKIHIFEMCISKNLKISWKNIHQTLKIFSKT